ncbi:Protein CBG25529 [Caenorhabditis briggsae]|uniref:Protein CBG25529 n=1 Tax=Caenorhabditis briggsae TaxID=6238 RepID=B6II52_CAEBR|nr:Protein CBG25529 [Caenorhabditis briggsae]CAR99582.1 Protein CBG25529 [Caenorhabditis briggsae]
MKANHGVTRKWWG